MVHIIIFTLLTTMIELMWRISRFKIPVYKRHFYIIIALGLLIVIDSVIQIIQPHQSSALIRLLTGFIGIGLGLILSSFHWLYSRQLYGMSWYQGQRRRKNPSNPLILVADPHWHDSINDLRNIQHAYPNADWLFLGDIFDLWLGIPGSDSRIENEFLMWVDETRKNQCWIGFWLGNREFFLDHLANRFDLIGEGIGGELTNEGLYWEHGDLINSADWHYRLWNLISRSSLIWLLTRILPKATIDRIAHYVKRRLHTAHNRYNVFFPQQAFLAAAQKYHNGIFITGHFHNYQVHNNGITIPWAKYGSFMIWHNQTIKPLMIANRAEEI